MINEIKLYLKENFDISEIDENSNIREDLNLDSISMLEFVMMMEEKYNIQLTDEDFDNIVTINDLIKFIEKNK